MSLPKIKTCPFCGDMPITGPKNPERYGNAWGFVRCDNAKCPAQPIVKDGEEICDERGTNKYIEAAIIQWNNRS